MSLRDEILSATEPDLQLQGFPIPEWGQSVYLRGWSAKEREVFERDFGDLDDTDTNRRARVLVRCIRDESGALVFTDSDAEALGGKQAGPIARLFAKVMDLSGLKQESLDAAKKN